MYSELHNENKTALRQLFWQLVNVCTLLDCLVVVYTTIMFLRSISPSPNSGGF